MSLSQTTGVKTATLSELIQAVEIVAPGAVFHHTHQFYLKGTLVAPEYPNDFAVWVAENLEERALAEKLACLDFYSMKSVEEIRRAIVRILEDYRDHFPAPRPARPGDEFFFNDSITLVIPTGFRARDITEFRMALRQVGPSSIYYHFFEARIRMESPSDDFSFWVEQSLGRRNLCHQIRQLDPYLYSLEGLRRKLIELVDMELTHG
jgi:hypothetical protein